MAMASSSGGAGALVLAFITVAVLLSPALSAPLDGAGFHSATCPQLESIVLSSVQAALQREVALAADLLRIFFHDCFPQGCDASVYLKGSGTEQVMGPNTTLQPRALQLVEDIRAKVHAACGATVSCADISALATRDAVVLSGGPNYTVPQGQFDSLAPASQNAVNTLPSPATSSVSALARAFSAKGLRNLADLVALSGAHTVGTTGCPFFRDRAQRMDDTFSRRLAANCSAAPSRLQNLDVVTPDLFDNGYYKALVNSEGVFTSDMATPEAAADAVARDEAAELEEEDDEAAAAAGEGEGGLEVVVPIGGQKHDPAWKHCLMVRLAGRDRLRCVYCGKHFLGGGIHRFKEHLARRPGNACCCPDVPADVEALMHRSLEEVAAKKLRKRTLAAAMAAVASSPAALPPASSPSPSPSASNGDLASPIHVVPLNQAPCAAEETPPMGTGSG